MCPCGSEAHKPVESPLEQVLINTREKGNGSSAQVVTGGGLACLTHLRGSDFLEELIPDLSHERREEWRMRPSGQRCLGEKIYRKRKSTVSGEL